jgi:FMN-dependent oxidoreductase (nitrilotriacetate monooxygenase family)
VPSMAKEILLNAFEMNCVTHLSPGLWRHPRDRSSAYKTLDYWTELARTLERGLFDGLFIADVLGVYDIFGGGPDTAVAQAAQVPVNDPLMLVSAMAAATRHLGFGITVNLSFEWPHVFARRISTLDHLTGGRIGWNIVTGYLDSAARGAGRDQQTPHDNRYAIAEEFMGAVYALWEGSWGDDAVGQGARRNYAELDRVRQVAYRGEHFTVNAMHLCEPSPQRTPVLYQAGSSPAGIVFAARHAECVFVSGPTKTIIARRVAALREAANAAGRNPRDLRVFAMFTAILDRTDGAAAAKVADYRRYADPEGALVLLSGWSGVDFAALDPDQIIEHVENETSRTALLNITRADPGRSWTVREAAEHIAIGGFGPVLVGSPETVADEMESWMDETDLDGFNLAFAVRPETFESVVDLLVPELQRRGRYKQRYAEGTLREKLFGRARLAVPHPAAAARFS